ncbi:hypothetical protein [Pseudoalteromonas phenolica]|nr:hypothetical protein [Pseudoalteromonas phenolica]
MKQLGYTLTLSIQRKPEVNIIYNGFCLGTMDQHDGAAFKVQTNHQSA